MTNRMRFVLVLTALCATVLSLNLSLYRHATADAPEVEGGERRPDRPDEATRFRLLTLQDRAGRIPAGALMRARRHVERMKGRRDAAGRPSGDVDRAGTEPSSTTDTGSSAPGTSGISRGAWRWIGPGNVGGRVRALAIHPARPQTMFAGSVGGGIWRTDDGGARWTPVDDFMANLAVTSIVMQPGNPAVMYASTGEGYYNFDAIRGAGVFKSLDGGTTWRQLAATASSSAFWYVNRLAISPDGRALLAATRSGMFRSTDGGTTFAMTSSRVGLQDVEFHPADSLRAIAAGNGRTSMFTTDGGRTWRDAAGLAFDSNHRIELAYARSDPDIVYASVDRAGGSVYRSSDGGASFALVFDGSPEILERQGWYNNTIWVNPKDSNVVVVGGVDFYRSVDGGLSWTKISDWRASYSAHADQHVLVEHPQFDNAANRIVFAGNDGGVYRMPDIITVLANSDPRWERLNNNLGITQFYGAAGNAASGTIVGGTQDNGTIRYMPASGASWNVVAGGDGGFSAADPSDPNYFYGEYVYLQIFRNDRGGAAYANQDIYGGISDAGRYANFIAPFILDPNNPRRMLAGGRSLWRTNDVKASTVSWSSIKPPNAGPSNISAVAIAEGNSNLIWVGHNDGSVYRTSNGTAASPGWTRASVPTNGMVTRVAINPFDAGIVYVTTGGFGPANVQRTIDGGATWTDATGAGDTGLPDVPVRDLEFDPADPNTVYAATEVGIFTSSDGGQSWDLPHDGPANVSVDELFTMGSTLVAATHGRGLFTLDLMPPAPAPSPLPSPWASRDVGAVGSAGSASYADGTYTVRGAGADVWGMADAFHFAYQPMAGDGEVVARVTAVPTTGEAWIKAGVMIRQTLDPGSAHGFMLVSAAKGLAFQRRTSGGGLTTSTSGGSGAAPVWVKLTRAGGVLTASRSADGSAWTIVGREAVALSGTVLVGLAVSSHDPRQAAAVTFDRVSISGLATTSTLPDGWSARDIGPVGTRGSTTGSGTAFTVSGAGADIWGAADAFHFAYRPLTGDGTIVARVNSVEAVHAWTKAGVMVRQTLEAGSPHALMLVSAGKGIAFQRRLAPGGLTASTSGGTGAAPVWLKLTRVGQVVTASASRDGASWTIVGRATFSMPATVWVGLAVSSHDTAALADVAFDRVTISTPSALPAGWTHADIGIVGPVGNASESGGTFTVKGGGADIWGGADAFHYAYRTLAGDGEVVARVVTVEPVHAWTKAGVMIREALDPGSAHATMLVSAGKGLAFQRRRLNGGLTSGTSAAGVAPRWVRLVRVGQVITAYASSDGRTWTTVGSETFAMPGAVYVGLAVSSHDATKLATSTLDSIAIRSLP